MKLSYSNANTLVCILLAIAGDLALVQAIQYSDRHTGPEVGSQAILYAGSVAAQILFGLALIALSPLLRKTLSESRQTNMRREALYAAGLLVALFGGAITWILVRATTGQPTKLTGDNPYWANIFGFINGAPETRPLLRLLAYLAPREIFSSITTPIIEEFIFIGILYEGLRRRLNILFVSAISASLFVLIHYPAHEHHLANPSYWVTLVCLRLLFNAIYSYTSNIAIAILAHSFWNLLSVVIHVLPFL